jgi:exonuclease V gamma subunit
MTAATPERVAACMGDRRRPRSRINQADTLAGMSYRMRDRAAQLLAEKSKQREDVMRALRADDRTGAMTPKDRAEAEALLRQLNDEIPELRAATRHA